ncbi:MAG: hypothetical protein IBX48_09310 [Thiomicrospira sp.]|uniref:FliH/SctL family protein n=1 Tax=Thiomicrospira sp. TaxID=935 RepID=UPI001A0BEF80|nr:FliH/SctL family protein [Thiomicrospira sp.]MBE0494522.1 hypothetical protein [Thiomicrospira sp.]
MAGVDKSHPDSTNDDATYTRLVRAEEVKNPEVHTWQFIDLEQDEKQKEQLVRSEVYERIQRELEPQISKQTAILKREAFEEAKQAGFEEGYQAGFETGQSQGIEKAEQSAKAEIIPKVQRLESILTDLIQPQELLTEKVFQQLAELAIKLAERMVEETLDLDKQRIIKFVEQAVALMPEGEAQIEVELHPDDLSVVAYYQQETDQSWVLKSNKIIKPGTCRVKKLNSVVNHNWHIRLDTLLADTQQLVKSMVSQSDDDARGSMDDAKPSTENDTTNVSS